MFEFTRVYLGFKCESKHFPSKIFVLGYTYRASCTVYFLDQLTQNIYIYISSESFIVLLC